MTTIRMSRMIFAGLVLTCSLAAQEKREAATPKEPAGPMSQSKRSEIKRATPKDANTPSLSAFDAFTNIVLPAGQVTNFTSAIDWTGADHVSIAIECPPSTSLQKVQILVTWAMPLAPFYTTTDVILGSNLLFANMGGAIVPAYGNQLQIVILNSGSTVACDQLTVYAVVH